ncbi:magnesium/cobalt transporter CorA [Nakamurella sp. DB0629]|uniref:Magnesium transport protein CorA n=1 Tax=Nakamurella aerolata TaxID=1656892 RepID=A0A849A6Q7_9ACTN|nr:magnesium/cobalt transporter CorA [Nakamurella aerolata]
MRPTIRPLLPSGGRRAGEPVAPPARNSYLVNCVAYVDGVAVPETNDPATALAHVRKAGKGFVWVGMFEPDADDMAGVAEIFGLHELAVEDAVTAHQRPKLENYKRYALMVIKTLNYIEHESPTTAMEIVETGEILTFLGSDFILTVRHGPHSELSGLRRDLEDDPEQLALGPATVLHAITDRVVDHYLTVVEDIEDDIDEIESYVFNPSKDVSIEQIYLLKREVLEMRRAVAPLRIPLQRLAQTENPLVPAPVREYFRDVEDHLNQVAEQVWTFDQLLSSLVDASLAEATVQQNEDMRKISAWAAIALVPTAIAGIYGMNFDYMPELSWPFGYPMVILVIVSVCVLLYRTLRKRGWL